MRSDEEAKEHFSLSMRMLNEDLPTRLRQASQLAMFNVSDEFVTAMLKVWACGGVTPELKKELEGIDIRFSFIEEKCDGC